MCVYIFPLLVAGCWADLIVPGRSEPMKFAPASFGATSQQQQSVLGVGLYTRDSNMHCTPEYANTINHVSPEEHSRIVLVDRGGCSFVTKAKIAQDFAHATAVIIVNNEHVDNISRWMLTDDGQGAAVLVPTVMVSVEDGVELKNRLLEDATYLEISLKVPRRAPVLVDVWLDAGDIATYGLLQDLYRLKDDLPGIVLRPHYNIYEEEGRSDECLYMQGVDKSYCAATPTLFGLNSNLKSKDILMENLRQMRLVQEEAHDKWWLYVYDFTNTCLLGESYRIGEECSSEVAYKHGIEFNSYVGDQTLLESASRNRGAGLTVNGVRYAYATAVNIQGFLPFLCEAFPTIPPACIQHYREDVRTESASSSGTFVLFFFLLVVVLAGVYFVHQKYMKRSIRSALRYEVMMEVRNAMDQYRQMEDGKLPNSNPLFIK